MQVTPGHTLANYEILDPLGAGGMGDVYRARDSRLGREVALKVLTLDPTEDSVPVRRFQREARALATLDHPNVVPIYSVEEEGGTHFLTMGLVRGQTLAELLPAGGMPIERVIDIAAAVCDGISAAHAHGIVHRDIKPANIMISAEGHVRLIDFGLAKRDAGCEELTCTGQAVGTIPYMSPEQLRGADVGPPSDIFSIGVLIFEMASGSRPFDGESGAEVISSILNGVPRRLELDGRPAPSSLSLLIERCLEKEPGERYASVGELRQELEALASGAERSARSLEPAPTGTEATWSDTSLSLPSRPSLAVLPFLNLGGPEDDHLTTGVWFDLNAELVKLAGLFLANGLSTATFAGQSVDPREVGRRLGVRHVLQGTVQRAGNRIRVTAQLLEAATDAPVWADRFEHTDDDLFELQDEINKGILNALDVQLLWGEGARTMRAFFRDPRARDLFYRAVPLSFSSLPADWEKARGLLEQVEELEPGHPQTNAQIGWTHYFEAASGASSDPARSTELARQQALKAIDGGDVGGMGFMLIATVHLFERQHDRALEASRVALERRPGCPWAYAIMGNVYNHIGEPHNAIPLASRAIQLSPLVPGLFPAVLATSYYLVGQYEQAAAAARSGLELDAGRLETNVFLAASLAALDREEEAAPVAEAIRRSHPSFSARTFADHQPHREPAALDGLVEDLERLGL